jgi:hypothetical protein
MSITEELSKKTVMEIKSYAKKNNIDIIGANKKIEILEIIANWTPEDAAVEEKQDIEEEIKNSIALFSERNIFWSGVGTLEKGYNFVTKEESEKWVTHRSVRIATPQEVASYYGKQK